MQFLQFHTTNFQVYKIELSHFQSKSNFNFVNLS